MKRKVIGLVLVLAIMVIGLATWLGMKSKPQGTGLIVEASAEEVFSYIRSLHSPLVLLNFWASWCVPCRAEFPELLNLRQTLADKGFQVVFVSIDEPRDLAEAEAFLKSNGVNFKTFFKGDRPLDYVKGFFPQWEGSVPVSLLIGPELKILDAWEGTVEPKELESRVLRQLKGL